MQPTPKVSNVSQNFGGSGFRKKTIIGRYKNSRICETNVKKPLKIHSIISSYNFFSDGGASSDVKKRQVLKGAPSGGRK